MQNKFNFLLLCICIFAVFAIAAQDVSGQYKTLTYQSFDRADELNTATVVSHLVGDQKPQSQSDSEKNDRLLAISLVRSSASQFIHSAQIDLHYFLLFEFLPQDLSAKNFKNLTNPPNHFPWFVLLSNSPRPSRLSGWKDANLLYKAVSDYHS